LLRFHPHIVHLHTSQGIAWFKDTVFVLMAKAFGCCVVLHMHGGHFVELYNGSTPLVQLHTRKVLGLADAVIEVSAERKRRLAHIAPKERVLTFRNCIDVGAADLPFRNRSTDGARALFLGVVGPSKGTYDLLEALARLKSNGCSLQLWVAGDEEREGELARARTQRQELDLRDVCQLVGTVRGEEKARLLREASLFVLPSYQEALPMSILEAMAAGLPVIATPVGGVPEVIRDGYNGFLVPSGDVDALAEKLTILVGDSDLRQVMGRHSREIAEQQLDVKPYVSRLVALYESLVGIA
jgi:glycosyltransferase involved in cell wall biosynthesis